MHSVPLSFPSGPGEPLSFRKHPSQMNAPDEAHAKVRTFSALKCQVSAPSAPGRVPSFPTSSCPRITTGVSLSRARASRFCCSSVSTSPSFCSTPVAATMWPRGTVSLTS